VLSWRVRARSYCRPTQRPGCILRKTRSWTCTSRERAAEVDAKLREENIARAEPAMRDAAERHGAELLPDRVQYIGFVALCGMRSGDECAEEVLRADGTVVLQKSDGSQRVVVPIGSKTPATVRLAPRPPAAEHQPLLAQAEVDPAIGAVQASENIDGLVRRRALEALGDLQPKRTKTQPPTPSFDQGRHVCPKEALLDFAYEYGIRSLDLLFQCLGFTSAGRGGSRRHDH
jgi:hypothetical protein